MPILIIIKNYVKMKKEKTKFLLIYTNEIRNLNKINLFYN